MMSCAKSVFSDKSVVSMCYARQKLRAKCAERAQSRRPRKNQIVSLQLLNFERSA
jgi:hypothetical protein